MLVQSGATNLLIDAGLPLKTLAPLLARRGVSEHGLHGILLTHEHPDHGTGAGPLSRRTGAPVIANEATLEAMVRKDDLPFECRLLQTGNTLGIGSIGIRSFPVPHDAVEPVGYVLEVGDQRVTYFTDAGSPTEVMQDALSGANLAVVEANYDPDWLKNGAYTDALKARVASETGHLSNTDCAEMIARRLEQEGSLSVWLAHLSRMNNSPSLARRSVLAHVSRRTKVPFALDIALRDHPSVSWRMGERAVQLSLM